MTATLDESRTASSGSVRYRTDVHGRVILIVTGRLDAKLAERLAALCADMAKHWPSGLAIDLTGISAATADGVDAVSTCVAVGRGLAEGIDIAASSVPGQRVLLAALALT